MAEIETSFIRWSRNGEPEKVVDVVAKQFNCSVKLRIYDAETLKAIEDTAQVISIQCVSEIAGFNTSGYIEAVTKSGSKHRFTFSDYDRFKAVRAYVEEVLCF